MNVLITQNSQNLNHSHTTNSQSTSTTDKQSANPSFSGTRKQGSFGGVIGSGQNGASISKLSVTSPFSYNKTVNGTDWICNWASGVANNFYNCHFDYTPAGSLSGDHTHDFTHTHGTTSNGGDEARPVDYTYKIWKRTA